MFRSLSLLLLLVLHYYYYGNQKKMKNNLVLLYKKNFYYVFVLMKYNKQIDLCISTFQLNYTIVYRKPVHPLLLLLLLTSSSLTSSFILASSSIKECGVSSSFDFSFSSSLHLAQSGVFTLGFMVKIPLIK